MDMSYKFKGEPAPWILGGSSGRMVTTPKGYFGDGFIADVDTMANALLISKAPEMFEMLVSCAKTFKLLGMKEPDGIIQLLKEITQP